MSERMSIEAAERLLGLRADEGVDDASERAWQDHLLPLDATVSADAPDDLFDRISDRIVLETSAKGTRTVDAEQGVWETIAPGIQRKLVHVDRRQGAQCYFVRMATGAVLPMHSHGQDEHCVVLDGRLRVGGREFGKGTYHLAERGTDHQEITAVEASEFFIYGGL